MAVKSPLPTAAVAIKGNGTLNSRKCYVFIYLYLALFQKEFQAAKCYVSSIIQPLKGRNCNFPVLFRQQVNGGNWDPLCQSSFPATWQRSVIWRLPHLELYKKMNLCFQRRGRRVFPVWLLLSKSRSLGRKGRLLRLKELMQNKSKYKSHPRFPQ